MDGIQKMVKYFMGPKNKVRPLLLDHMRNECLIEAGFEDEPDLTFDTNLLEGTWIGMKQIVRGLLQVFSSRAVAPHRFCWAVWVYCHVLYNRIRATLRGNIKEFGGLKHEKWRVDPDHQDTGSCGPDTRIASGEASVNVGVGMRADWLTEVQP